jgi:nucleoside-diphosphate-sugar epimerase
VSRAGLAVGLGGADGPAGRAAARALRARGHVVADEPHGCAVVVDCASAPTAPGEPGRPEAGMRLLRAAEETGAAAFVLGSSTLVYGDGGDEWLEAAEPLLDPAPEAAGLLELELEIFASGLRFLVLRQGILFGPDTPGAEAVLSGRARLTDAWVPLLHPADLGAWVLRGVEDGLHGVFDAVSDVVRGSELATAVGVGADAAGEPGWAVSRRVVTMEDGRPWRASLYEASASQRA